MSEEQEEIRLSHIDYMAAEGINPEDFSPEQAEQDKVVEAAIEAYEKDGTDENEKALTDASDKLTEMLKASQAESAEKEKAEKEAAAQAEAEKAKQEATAKAEAEKAAAEKEKAQQEAAAQAQAEKQAAEKEKAEQEAAAKAEAEKAAAEKTEEDSGWSIPGVTDGNW